MLIRLLPNTYTRCSLHYGHIANIQTKHQNTFNTTGKIFIEQLTYEWQSFEEISAKIISILNLSMEDSNSMIEDLIHFINNLKDGGYIETKVFQETQNNNAIPLFNTTNSYENKAPQTLIVEITDACNERCVHCYISNSTKCVGDSMSLMTFTKLVDDFKDLGGKSVRLTGGEIFLHKDIRKMIEYCSKKGLSVELLSNLIAVKNDDIAFLKQNVSYIQVSLYSTNNAIHDFITTIENSCKITKANIEKLLKAGILVSIALPIMKANQFDIIEVLQYAKERNIPVTIEPILLAQQDGNKENLAQRLTIDEIKAVLNSIAEYDFLFYEKQFRHHMTDDDNPDFDFLKYLFRPICEIGKEHICVNPRGDYQPCTGWRRMKIGQYTENISDVWYSKKMDTMRGLCEYNIRQCVSCKMSDFCVRCVKRNDYERGNLVTINPMFCEVAKIAKNIYDRNTNKGIAEHLITK